MKKQEEMEAIKLSSVLKRKFSINTVDLESLLTSSQMEANRWASRMTKINQY
jgi:hypothetical protein